MQWRHQRCVLSRTFWNCTLKIPSSAIKISFDVQKRKILFNYKVDIILRDLVLWMAECNLLSKWGGNLKTSRSIVLWGYMATERNGVTREGVYCSESLQMIKLQLNKPSWWLLQILKYSTPLSERVLDNSIMHNTRTDTYLKKYPI
jgi:hypothetical protein